MSGIAGMKKEAGIMPGLHASQNETLSAGTPASDIRISGTYGEVKGRGRQAERRVDEEPDG